MQACFSLAMTLWGSHPCCLNFRWYDHLDSQSAGRQFKFIWLIMDLWCRKRVMFSLILKYYLYLWQLLILACRAMSSQSLALYFLSLINVLDKGLERRKDSSKAKVTCVSWIVFVVTRIWSMNGPLSWINSIFTI
jgi:hypothetical protein